MRMAETETGTKEDWGYVLAVCMFLLCVTFFASWVVYWVIAPHPCR